MECQAGGTPDGLPTVSKRSGFMNQAEAPGEFPPPAPRQAFRRMYHFFHDAMKFALGELEPPLPGVSDDLGRGRVVRQAGLAAVNQRCEEARHVFLAHGIPFASWPAAPGG